MTPRSDLGYVCLPFALYLKSITCATDDFIGTGLFFRFIIPVCPLKIPCFGAKCAVVKPRERSSFIYFFFIQFDHLLWGSIAPYKFNHGSTPLILICSLKSKTK